MTEPPRSAERAPVPPGADARRAVDDLRACVRDLLGLLTLPVLWRERDGRGIFVGMLEALEAALPIAFAYARVESADGGFEVLRAGKRAIDDPESPWRALARVQVAASPHSTRVDSPAGPLSLTQVPLGYHGVRGGLLIGAARSEFPSITDAALLRAAASLADNAWESARVLADRERALRAKDEFLALLGHELRNPLAPIATAVHLMRLRSGATVPRELDVIERQVAHLLRLVDDLLDVARITRGKVELKREPTDVSSLLAKALETASPLLDRAGHRLVMDVDPRLVIDVDPTRMAQVFANLLTNAAKYTPPGGTVTARAGRQGDEAVISVADTGIGIPPEVQARIFDMFVQVGQSRARSDGGLGIGLALVKNLVAMHGGTVSVLSGGSGEGSTFTVSLPLVARAAAQKATALPLTAETLAGRRVLVVDDNVDASTLLADALRAHGADVMLSHDGLDALEQARLVRPHAVLLDIGLPVMDGYEVCAGLRDTLGPSNPRVYALTGYGQESDRARSESAGFAGHFVKPVDMHLLVQTLSEDVPIA